MLQESIVPKQTTYIGDSCGITTDTRACRQYPPTQLHVLGFLPLTNFTTKKPLSHSRDTTSMKLPLSRHRQQDFARVGLYCDGQQLRSASTFRPGRPARSEPVLCSSPHRDHQSVCHYLLYTLQANTLCMTRQSYTMAYNLDHEFQVMYMRPWA